MELGGLKTGINVDIKRTDGRIHTAVVSNICDDTRTVTVEWFERGETKGKEIDFDQIYELNSDLKPSNAKISINQCDDDIDRDSIEDLSDDTMKKKMMLSPVPVSKSISSKRSRIPSRSKKSQPSNKVLSENVIPTPRETPRVNSRNTPVTTSGPDTSSSGSQSANKVRPSYARIQPPSANVRQIITESDPVVKKNGIAAIPLNKQISAIDKDKIVGRKSSCVTEVEKIKQKREERRIAAQARKDVEEKAIDKTIPNWEFLLMIKEYRATLDYHPISSDNDILNTHQICVAVRKRPLNKKENGKKEVDVVTIPQPDKVIVHEPKLKVDLTKYLENQIFHFDYAFDENSTNEVIYRFTAQPLVQSIFEGGMATCFAYGQTGSGKTHTMGGDFSSSKSNHQDSTKGIYYLAARDLFRLLNTKYKKANYQCSSSFFEIYSGKVYDLLNKKQKLRVLEDGKQQVQVVGLKEEVVRNVDDVLKLISVGNAARTSGTTSANQHSSRSHAIFQLMVRSENTKKLIGKFSLIDLAGNERGADTASADRQTRLEGAEINKSLLALKECIRALGRKGAHLPFRASKLTQVLRDSFIGETSRTCMIAMISPGTACVEHSLNTLRYADRVKELGPSDFDAKMMDNEMIMNGKDNHNPTSPQHSDLMLLKTANEGEVSDDLINFHEAVQHMQELEEDVIDMHRALHDGMPRWQIEDNKLLAATEKFDYDSELYAENLENLLLHRIEQLTDLKDKVVAYRSNLAEEENLSRVVQSSNRQKKP